MRRYYDEDFDSFKYRLTVEQCLKNEVLYVVQHIPIDDLGDAIDPAELLDFLSDQAIERIQTMIPAHVVLGEN